MMKNNKVCGVVVTFNRKELLLRNVNSLLMQSYPLDILIVDNASTDGTFEYLKQNNIIDNGRVNYIRNEKNEGGAGGFYKGEKAAYDLGYEYIWLMDDDGYCVYSNTLSLLMDIANKNTIAHSYVVYDTKTLEPTFVLKGASNYKDVKKLADNNLVVGYGTPYNGTLVPRECFKKVGFTDNRFFIYGDETEFFYRTKNADFEWVTNIDSIYYHPVNRKVVKEIKILKYNYDIKDQPIWKWYLEMRNTTYVGHKYLGKSYFFYFCKMMIVSLFSKDKKIKRIKYGDLAIKDAKSENFTRDIPFNI